LATVDDPESIRADIPNFMFFMAIQELAIGCGLDDFGVDDIVEPDYKNAQRNLSALINFAKFREERLVEFRRSSHGARCRIRGTGTRSRGKRSFEGGTRGGSEGGLFTRTG
jgi:hypothetical protein